MQKQIHKLTTSNLFIITILCFISFPIFALFNSFIFDELNFILLFVLLFFYTIYNVNNFNIKLLTSLPLLCFSVFLAYTLLSYQPGKNLDDNMQLLSLFSYFLIFFLSGILFYKKKYISDLLWFITVLYIISYIARISLDIEAAIEGTNLSSGIVVTSLAPFVLINLQKYMTKYFFKSCIIIISLIIWCSIIGSRASTLGLALFLLTFCLWPVITKNKILYFGFFLSCFILFLSLFILYVFFVTDADFSLSSGSGFAILTKRIGTRLDIWVHLIQVIINGDWVFGNGSNVSTIDLIPLSHLDFSMNRKNLASHSLILECIYRIGIVGLVLFFLFILSLWSYLWNSRNSQITRIVCSSIIMLVPICFTSTFLFFSVLHLRCAFFWVILGFGYGSATYYNKNSQTHLL